MITVKHTPAENRTEVICSFKIKLDIFEATYDDLLLRDAIEARMMRQLHKELDNMYFNHAFEGRVKED